MKKKLILLITLLLLPLSVKASDKTDALMKKLAPDLKNAVLKMKKPTSLEEAQYSITVYVNSIIDTTEYDVWADCDEPYNVCTISFNSYADYEINVTYDEPKSNETITGYINKMKEFVMGDPSSFYVIEDLSLINYYLTGTKSELWNPGAPSRALKFSDLTKVTNGSNVSFYMVVGMGTENAKLMFENAIGEVGLFYNGYMYTKKTNEVYLKRVIYIPSNTEETTDAYKTAAQKRIREYLGDNSVTVTLGGTLEDLNNEVKEQEYQACLANADDPSDCDINDMIGAEDEEYEITGHDGNYYIINIGGRDYKFYIVKGTEENLKKPVYNGLDLNTNIVVTSEDSSIPLDSSLTVNNVEDSFIKDKIGTSNYKAYDIKIHSDAKDAEITELKNGKFLVRIPIPEELQKLDKLTVWYISSDGNKEEHTVTPKTIDGIKYAEFETNHFSTYVLSESVEQSKTGVTNPPTSDNINMYIILLGLSIIGIVYNKNKLLN